jgi:hypothetical protein
MGEKGILSDGSAPEHRSLATKFPDLRKDVDVLFSFASAGQREVQGVPPFGG